MNPSSVVRWLEGLHGSLPYAAVLLVAFAEHALLIGTLVPGEVILADRLLPPRKHGVLLPGPQSHAAKLAFEKYFLWKTRHGYVGLP